jgi:thioredoxin reductase (NADPH)
MREINGVFLYLAVFKPGTDFLQDSVERDAEGSVTVDGTLRTSVDGIFAGGNAETYTD